MKPYEELYELVGAYVRQLAADPALMADVTQDVLLKVHQSIGTLHDQEKLVPWLKRIVYTTLQDHYRAHRRYRSLPPPEASPAGNQAVADCLLLLLHLLPPAQRDLLEAVELRGISQTAYGLPALGASRRAWGAALHRARGRPCRAPAGLPLSPPARTHYPRPGYARASGGFLS